MNAFCLCVTLGLVNLFLVGDGESAEEKETTLRPARVDTRGGRQGLVRQERVGQAALGQEFEEGRGCELTRYAEEYH